MLNSGFKVDVKQEPRIIDEPMISILTALFIDGLVDEKSEGDPVNYGNIPGSSSKLRKEVFRSNSRLGNSSDADQIKAYCARKAEPKNTNRKSKYENSNATIRPFILRLSDAINNLLMGIWGNLSLMNMTLDKQSPVSPMIGRTELLIHTGSAILNAIFGYMSERRSLAKNIRLNQLIKELSGYLPLEGDLLKQDIIQAAFIAFSGQNHLTIIARDLADILEHFIDRICSQYDQIRRNTTLIKGLEKRMQTIDGLIGKCREIIRQLKLYAGHYPLNSRKTNMAPLVEKEVDKIRKKNSDLSLSIKTMPNLPSIHADRTLMRYVLSQLMENAVSAMPKNGRLTIDMRVISAETPQNRCIAYRWVDSMVITISDTGYGMDLDTLLRVFEPFFVGQRNPNRLGMGLAAVWGIIKSHGGYIHVRSKTGQGSTFKIYLPTQ